MSDDDHVQDILGLDSFSLTEGESGAYVWFEGVSHDEFARVRETGTIANDEFADNGILPTVETLASFVDDYPMFSMFGWANLSSSGTTDIYLTGIEFDGRENGNELVVTDRIDMEAFLRLKEGFFDHFKTAIRIEMTPETIFADYCWTPAQLARSPATR